MTAAGAIGDYLVRRDFNICDCRFVWRRPVIDEHLNVRRLTTLARATRFLPTARSWA
jgi:hypothetical protein